MIEPRFTLNAVIWKEVVAALKPHVGKDEFRPAITGVRVRYSGGQVTLEGTDSYSALRVQAMADDALLGGDTPPIDVVVPGAEFMSLKPSKKDVDVVFQIQRDDAINGETGELAEAGVSTITDGTTTVRLVHVCHAAEYPDFDKITRAAGRTGKGADLMRFNPVILGRLAKLPGVVTWRSIGEGRPVFFSCDGEGRQDHSPAEYQGVLMPVAGEGEDAPTWEDWQP